MENFNKNWLVILLVAVIFGTLGFLLGRTTGDDDNRHERRGLYDRHGNEFILEHDRDDEDDVETIVSMDTVVKDGKQVITKEVKKIKK
ncbi:MAG: hypothetical protein HC811_04095 [Flammeovirgaceae bacterium]|nr:hypothetical protein [Flammeovirgaceae bacterium]